MADGVISTQFGGQSGNGKWEIVDHKTLKLVFGKVGEHTLEA